MMARNNYFKKSNRESRLFEQLVVEQIKIYGFDVHYIFREFQDLDSLFGEDPVSKFRKSFQVEMFVGNYEFFETQDKILDKFGINLQDSISLLVSKKRFTEETAKYDGETIPKEGDIIYFPEYGGLYEIKYVNSRNSFFAYELSCEKFRYSGEQLDTEIVEVDRIEEVFDNMREFQLTDIVGKFHEGEVIYQGLTLEAHPISARSSTTNAQRMSSRLPRKLAHHPPSSNSRERSLLLLLTTKVRKR